MKIEADFGTVNLYDHWVLVLIHNTATGERRRLFWENLPWDVRIKWDWYFKYRAALAQVQNPRLQVHLSWGHREKKDYALLNHQNRLRAKKGKITEFTNKINAARAAWTDIFPIEEHPNFQKATGKLDRLKQELEELQREEVVRG